MTISDILYAPAKDAAESLHYGTFAAESGKLDALQAALINALWRIHTLEIEIKKLQRKEQV